MSERFEGSTEWPQLPQRRPDPAPPGWEQPPAASRPPAVPGHAPAPEPSAWEPTIVDATTVSMPPVPAAAPETEPAYPATCRHCGGSVGPEGYCGVCGAKAPSRRDHFEESPASWVGGVCDRGVRHPRNEDAMALSADPEPGSRAVVVVCDGVSSSADSDVASLAGARAARDLLTEHRPSGMGVPASAVAAQAATLTQAAAAANDAVVANIAPGSDNPAACTFVACVVLGTAIHHASLGDSRAYWVGDAGDPQLLTTDDSLAQEGITAGVPRKEAESGADAHTITRWLGQDATDVIPRTGHVPAAGDGWLLVCSDGLWNYASDPAQLAAVLRGRLEAGVPREPTALASALVDWANAQGGHDNITVALVRLGELPLAEAPDAAEPEADDPETPTTKTRRLEG